MGCTHDTWKAERGSNVRPLIAVARGAFTDTHDEQDVRQEGRIGGAKFLLAEVGTERSDERELGRFQIHTASIIPGS